MIERRVTVIDIYLYPDNDWSRLDLAGFRVEASDGHIGKVDEASHEIGSGEIIVDTGPWIFGKKVMLPVGVISRIDEDDRRVWVNLTKDEIKSAPEFDESRHPDRAYREELGNYYSLNRPPGPDYGKDDRPTSH
jgi:hypothetical protein